MDFFGSDEFLVMFMPILVYWIYSGIYEVLSPLENYRLHSKRDEDTKNLVSKRHVLKRVLFQQAIQATISLIACKVCRLFLVFFHDLCALVVVGGGGGWW